MSIQNVSIELRGEKLYQRGFDLMEREARDLSEPLAAVGEVLRLAVGRQFESEGSAEMGGKWKPLSRDYAEWKDAAFPGRPILVASGDMRAAAVSRGALRVTPRQLVYEVPGEEGERAYWHDVGAGRLPARRIVALAGATRRAIDRVFVEWVNVVRRGVIGMR